MHGYTCIECQEVYIASKEKRNHLCPKCGVKKVDEVNKQLREKQGPYYELWKKEFEHWRHARSSTQETIHPEG